MDMSGNGTTKDYSLITDGAFSSSRNQMGIGLVFVNKNSNKIILKYSRMYKGGTNNIAELAAVIVGLRMIKKPINSLTIYTDSEYVRGCASLGWKRKKNQPLWKIFDEEFKRVSELCLRIEFRHVKGHEGNYYNEMCDKLAVKASQEI